jgi:Ni/Fe-hydrogenase subunit HybB-like protein
MFMLEKAVVGGRRYWIWIGSLLAVITVGFLFYLHQLSYGLGLTGMSRNISWGLYIGQFTFMVGVAASAVMVVLPYYLHNHKEFARMTILGELLAVSAVSMCMLFVFIDMGQPMRVLNVILYPHPRSIMFWDLISLFGYLLLNAAITLVTLHAEQQDVSPPHWIKPIILLSIPWAISIHTVTAFLYSGLPGRLFWRTAIMAPRFLASAFASGPALLILLCLLLRRLTGYDVGKKAISGLAVIVTYAMVINVFFMLMELFTSLYSRVPALMEDFQNLYLGTLGHTSLLPWGRTSLVLMTGALILLLVPATRRNEKTLALASAVVFASLWIDKGVCMVVGGFIPSPLGTISRYVPTLPEMTIALGVWAVGALMVTVFYKIALSVETSNGASYAPGYEFAGTTTAAGAAFHARSVTPASGDRPVGQTHGKGGPNGLADEITRTTTEL